MRFVFIKISITLPRDEVTTGGFWIDGRILIQRVTTLYSSPLQTQSRLHSRCVVAAFKSGRSFSSGFPNSSRSQLPA
jgi:hypothetical protein